MTKGEYVMAFVRGNDYCEGVVDEGKDLFVPSDIPTESAGSSPAAEG